MKFIVVSVSKLKDEPVVQLENSYRKRLRTLDVIEIPPATLRKCKDSKTEGEVLLRMASGFDKIVSMDEAGEQLSSLNFSNLIKKWSISGVSSMAFLIGGAYGLSSEVKQKSSLILSLSSMTFPFQLARLLTVEQIYRADCIIKGHPYHKI